MHKKNRLKAIVAIAVALVFILPTSAMFASDGGTLSVQPEMSILPVTQTVGKGDSFTVDVYIDPKDYQIVGASVDLLSFDPAIIQATIIDVPPPPHASVTFNDFFYPYVPPSVFRMYGIVDNFAGTITGISEITLPYYPVTTPNVWVTIDFTAIDVGTSPITLDIVGLPDENGDKIEPITIFNGEVIVDPISYELDITVEGSGTTDPLPGTYAYSEGTIVDLEAIPDLGWLFDHWDGDVADPSSAITNITMDTNKTVTANFTEDHYILTVSTVGSGHVDVAPDKEFYLYGEEPQLTAVADLGWTFDSWSGGLGGNTNPSTILMDGNKDVTATFTEIDTIPPVTICILNPPEPDGDNGWYVSVVTVTLVATDEGSGVELTWYRLDGGYWKPYTGKPFEVDKEGYHTIEYYSFDRAGNKEDTNTTEFKIDIKLPLTTHEFDGFIGKEGWFVSNVTVTLGAGDATSGVNYTKYKLDNDTWMNYTEPFDVTENGEYTLYYYSADLAGNTEPTNEVDFKIDHDIVPPVTIHEFDGVMGDNDWYTSNVVIVLTAEDDSAGVDYTMYMLDDDVEWQKYTGLFSVTEEGEHVLYYYSVDKVGNKEDNKGPFEFKIDQTVPTIDLDVEGSGSTWMLTATVSDETSGISKVEFYVNGEYLGESTECPYKWTYSGTNGPAQAIAFDNAGNFNFSAEVTPQSHSQSQSVISTSVTLSRLSVFR